MGTHTIPRMSVEERAKLVLGLITIRPRTAAELEAILLCDRTGVMDAVRILRRTPGQAAIVDWRRPPRGRGRWIPVYGMGDEDVEEPKMDKNKKNELYRMAEELTRQHRFTILMQRNVYNLLVAFHYTPEMTRANINEALHFEYERSGDKTLRHLRKKRIVHVCGHEPFYAIDGRGRWIERFAWGDKPDVEAPKEKPKDRRNKPRVIDDPMLSWIGKKNERITDEDN